jgi:hypothetical protein
MWKETFVDHFKALLRHLSGVPEEAHENPWSIFETGAFRILKRDANPTEREVRFEVMWISAKVGEHEYKYHIQHQPGLMETLWLEGL